MLHRYLAGALGALVLLPAASAQERVALEGPRYYTVVENRDGTEVLRHYDPGAAQVVRTAAPGGFVYGTNGYGDRAKATCFAAPPEPIQIESVTGYLFVGDGAFGITYDLVIYNGMPGLDGEPGAGPQGTPIYTQSFDSSTITATPTTNPIPGVVHTLTTPQTISTSFCVGFEWPDGTAAEELGMVNQDLTGQVDPSPFDWELWASPDGWFNVNQAWGGGTLRTVMWLDVNYTTASAGEEGPAAAARLVVAPNPIRGEAALTFAVESAQRVAVEVFDALGRRVALVHDGVLAAGAHSVVLSGAALRAGTYVVRVSGEDFAATRRVVVQR